MSLRWKAGSSQIHPELCNGWLEVAFHPCLSLNSSIPILAFQLSIPPSKHPLSCPLIHLLSWQLLCEPVSPALCRALLSPCQLLLNLLGCPSSWAGGALPSQQTALPWVLSGLPATLPSCLPHGGTGGAQLPLNVDERKGRGISGVLQGSNPFWLSGFPEVGPTDSVFCLSNGGGAIVEGLADEEERVVEKSCPTFPSPKNKESFRCSLCAM